MTNFKNILNSINQYVRLTKDEADFFTSHLILRRFKKRQFLVQADEPCRNDYFIVSGLVKEYFTDISGKDFIFRFVQENDWSADYGSYMTGNNATLNIQALEEVEAFCINYTDTEHIMQTYAIFEKCFRIYFQKAYTALQSRLFDSLSKSVEQRYEEFMQNHFDLSQRIPQHQIAAYLGVSPEFLSKIRQCSLNPSSRNGQISSKSLK